MKNILNKKELSIIKATGSNSKSVMALYNSSIGRDRALIRAGMWLQATMSLDYVSEPAITGSQAANKYLRPYYSNLKGEEEIWALLLDNKNCPMEVIQVNSTTTPAGASLDLRKLMKVVLSTNANSIILSHNHPSGNTNASSEDVRMSRDLSRLLQGVGVELLDHIIITPKGEFSKISF